MRIPILTVTGFFIALAVILAVVQYKKPKGGREHYLRATGILVSMVVGLTILLVGIHSGLMALNPAPISQLVHRVIALITGVMILGSVVTGLVFLTCYDDYRGSKWHAFRGAHCLFTKNNRLIKAMVLSLVTGIWYVACAW